MTIAVVGGGISGLALAHALSSRGRQVMLFEGSERLGGVIRSTVREGFLTESGPNGFLDQDPVMRGLAGSLGLADKLRVAEPVAKRRFVFTRGALREVPSSPPRFLFGNLLPLGARLRLVWELFSKRGKGADESLTDFGIRHLGRGATRVLVDAMQSGILAGDPNELSVAAAFPKVVALEKEHRSLVLALMRLEKARRKKGPPPPEDPTGKLTTFEGGLETLTTALGKSLGSSVHLSSEVRRLHRPSGRWHLSVLERGREALYMADEVVVALPALGAASVIKGLDVALAAELEAIRYAPVSVVHLGFREEDFPTPLEGFGFLIPEQEQRRLLGVLYISSVFPWRAPPGRVLLTCMVGGARHPEYARLSEEELRKLATEEVHAILRTSAEPGFTQVQRWERAIPQYNLGHLARLERLEAGLVRHPGLHLAGNAYRGVGLNDCVRNAAVLARKLVPRTPGA